MSEQRVQSIKTKYIRISGKDREHILSELALLLKAGVAVGEIFQSLRESSRSRRLRRVLGQMMTDIDEGAPLWQTLERSGLLTQQALALVELGEQSGNLIENLHVAANQEEKQRSFRTKVYSALLYPTFVLSITIVVGVGVAWFLLPRLADTFAYMNVQLPLISSVLINVGRFLRDSGHWAIPAALGGTALVVYVLFFAPVTRRLGQRLLLHIPGISRLLREIEIARFGYLLGTLLRSGMSVTASLELLAKATTVEAYRKLYLQLKKSFDDGFSFSASLPKYAKKRLLPPSVQQMVIAGERSGALPETLLSAGVMYEEKADITAHNLETILEPVMLVIVWLGVLAVAVAVILPVYSLLNGIGGR